MSETGSTPIAAPVADAPAAAPSAAPKSRNQQIADVVAKVEAQEAGKHPGPENQTITPTQKGETEAPAEAPAEKSPAQVRKEFLDASKAQRKAQEEQKRAREMAEKADKVKKYQAEWKKDPSKILDELGIPKDEFYQTLTNQYLQIQPQEDPVEKKVKEKIDPVLEELRKEKEAIAAERDRAVVGNIVATQIIPMFNADDALDKYGALLSQFDNDKQKAAHFIYNECFGHWQRTGGTNGGQAIPFDQAAQMFEDKYSELYEAGIKRLIGMKKFEHLFKGVQSSSGPTNIAKPEQPKQRTLTNALSGTSAAPTTQASAKWSPRIDDRISNVLKKHNLK